MNTFFIQRQANLIDYALCSLLRKGLKNFGVFFLFSLLIFLTSSFQLLCSALNETSARILTASPDITVQQMIAGRQVLLPQISQKTLNDIFGITAVRERIWGYYFDPNNGANYTVIGVEHPKDFATDSMHLTLATGRFPVKGAQGEVVLGQAVGAGKDLITRSKFSLFRPDLTLASFERVGTFSQGTSLVTDDLIVMSLADARDLFSIPTGYITDLLVQTGNPEETPTIAQKIARKIPGSRVVTRKRIQQTYRSVFGWRSGIGSICLLAALAAFVILAWDKASGLSAEETREVGILKMLGWQTRDIMTIRFWESGIVAGLAFFVGYGLSWSHLIWFNGALFKPLLLGWSVLKPSYSLSPPLHFNDLLLLFSLTVVPYLAATIFPAWRSSIIRPDSVI